MKFSIRDLFWLTVVVALLVCNWLQYSAYVSELDVMNSHLEDKTYESGIWEARTRQLENRADMLIERINTAPATNSPAPALNPPKP
jgi:hypothetical protein